MNSSKISFLLFILGLVCAFLNAQTTFNKVVDIDSSWDFGQTIVKTNSGFLVECISVDSKTREQFLATAAINHLGEVVKRNKYSFGELVAVRYGRNLTLKNGNVASYRTLQQYDTVKKDFTTWTALTLFTPFGDTLWTKQYLDSNRHVVARTLIETDDAGFWLIGDETINSSNRDPLVYKTDKWGKIISTHSLPHNGVGGVYSVVKYPNGKYYVGGNAGSINDGKIYIAALDSNMQPIWTKYFPSGVGHAAFVTISDDNNILFGSDTLINRQSFDLYTSRKQFFKIDTLGTIIWRKLYDEIGEGNHFSNVIALKNGGILALGRKEPPPPYTIYYTLTKLTPEGDTIWMHRYAYEDIETINYLWDMVATEDGGVLMVGDVTPSGSRYQDVWLVKVDSNGCINNDCEKTLVYDTRVSVNEAVKAGNGIFIYPNPSSGFFKIEGLHSNADYLYSVVNSIGQIMQQGDLSENKLNVAQLTSGIYYLNLFHESGKIVTQKLVIHE